MSHREAAPKERSSSSLKILAKSEKGRFVLVKENGKYKVRWRYECTKEGIMFTENLGNFSPDDHKKNLLAAAYHDISPCVVITYNKTRKLVVYNLKKEGEWGIQWLILSSFEKVLKKKKGPDVDQFELLYKNLPAGVDSGRIPETFEQRKEKIIRKLEKLNKRQKEITQQLDKLKEEFEVKRGIRQSY